jgi:FAD synthetase
MNRRVLVFGTFDGLHAGHLFFLKQAKREGDLLFVSVTRDSHVQKLKNKSPNNSEQIRLETILQIPGIEDAELSDETLGSYGVVKKIDPDIIVLGYDQKKLELSLRKWMAENKQEIPIEFTKQLKDEYGKNMG